MGHQGQTEDSRTNWVTRPLGGWTPSRGFWIGMSTVGIFSLALVVAGAFAAGLEEELATPGVPTPTIEPAEVSYAPRPRVPREDIAREQLPAGAAAAVVDGLGDGGRVMGERDAVAIGATSANPAVLASSWSATPIFDPPAPAPELTAAAVALAERTEARFGVDIVLEGQDWGADGAEQTANIGAVASAFEVLPLRVTSSVVSSSHGTLQILSNREGRTHDGWKPYGGTARSFYTNSDQGPDGYRAANEIVLATGATPMTVAHEAIHSWAFADVAPGDYVLALLGDRMRSFMAATGWKQLVGDDEVRASADEAWDTVNRLFAYEGLELRFVDEGGSRATFESANPLEAIASMGAIYYARPAGTPMPAWDAAWAWFDSNLG